MTQISSGTGKGPGPGPDGPGSRADPGVPLTVRPGLPAVIEVTFTPAEPQLAPGAARAVLVMLLRARDNAGDAGQCRT
jgi:hypothetical protein